MLQPLQRRIRYSGRRTRRNCELFFTSCAILAYSAYSTRSLPAVQLLHKMRVRAADGNDTLLKVVKNPVTAHLPIGATVVGLEVGGQLVDAVDLPQLLPKDRPVVFVIGAMSHGDINPDYITNTFSLSRYPLSAACAVGKLMNAYEHAWGVL